MKKQLTVALGLAVLATPAFATKARLEALGEDNFGSYFINDNRNQFLNPAQITNHKDLATFEFGSSSTGSAVTGDAANTPKAEGGINKAYGNMVYGLHFGNSTPSAITARALGGANTQERNPIDLFVGGDAGVKWGASATYEQFDGGTTTTRLSSNALRLRGGVIAGDLQAFLQVSLKGDAKDFQGGEVEGKASYFGGVSQAWQGNTIFADYKIVGAEYRSTTVTTKSDWDFTEARVGLGRVERLNDKANLFAKITLERRTVENDGGATAGDLERYIVPLNIGLETEATSWLTLRASVGQYLWSKQEFDPKGAGSKTDVNLANTAVRAGATLKFGELSVDGLISTDADGDSSAIASTDASTNGGNGTLRTDNIMTRVSMTYRF